MNHFEQAKEIISKWPKWKQDIANKTIGKSAMCEANAQSVLGEVAPQTRERLLEETLKAVLKRWKYDADQGDGIHETDYRLYNRAMKLIDQDYEPL